MQIQEPLLNKNELASRLGLTGRAVDSLIYSKKIPVIRINRKIVRFNWQDVQQALGALVVKSV